MKGIKRKIASSVLKWRDGILSPLSSAFAHVYPCGGFGSVHRVHPLVQVLVGFECSLNIPSWNRFSLPLPASLSWEIELEKLGTGVENLAVILNFLGASKGCSLRAEVSMNTQ